MGWILVKLAALWQWMFSTVSSDECPYCKTSLSEGDHTDCRKHWAIR